MTFACFLILAFIGAYQAVSDAVTYRGVSVPALLKSRIRRLEDLCDDEEENRERWEQMRVEISAIPMANCDDTYCPIFRCRACCNRYGKAMTW